MANIDNELIKETLLRAIENAIRFEHLQDGASSTYEIDKLASAHRTLIRKVYKSQEMRKENWLAHSIQTGQDLGTVFTRAEIEKKALKAGKVSLKGF